MIGILQFDPILGDIVGNKLKIIEMCSHLDRQLDLMILPEMCLIGYGDSMIDYSDYAGQYMMDFLKSSGIAKHYLAGGILVQDNILTEQNIHIGTQKMHLLAKDNEQKTYFNAAWSTFSEPVTKYNLFMSDVGFSQGTNLYNIIDIPNIGQACISICNDFNNPHLISQVIEHQPDYFIVIAAITYNRVDPFYTDHLKQINHWASTLNKYRGTFIACNQCQTDNNFVGGSCVFKVFGGEPFIKTSSGYGKTDDEILDNIHQTLDTLEFIFNLDDKPGLLLYETSDEVQANSY